MADPVKIVGTDLDGAILKNAATEATLERLANAMEGKQRGLKDKILGVANKVIEGNIKAQKTSTSAFDSFTNSLNSGTKAGSQLLDVFTSLVGSGIGTTFSLLATAGGAFLEFVKNGYTTFQETSQVGAAFNNDLFDLRRSAAEASIPLDEFSSLIRKNSETFARLGLNVTNGTKLFGDLASTLKSDFGNELTAMGFSLSDINEGLANYLDIQVRTGRLDLRNTNAVVEGTRNYLVELDKITKLTGMNRKAQEDLSRKMAVDPIIQSMMEGIEQGSDAFNKAQANMAVLQQLGGDQAVQMAKELAAMNPGDDAKLFAQQLGLGMEQFRDLITGVIDPKEFIAVLKQRREATKALTEEEREQQTALIARLPGLAKAFELLKRVEGLGDMEAVEREQAARNKITEALGVFSNTLNKIYNDSIAQLLNSPVFAKFEEKLNNLSKIFIDNSGNIIKVANDFMEGINNVLDNFMHNVESEGFTNAILDFFKDMFTELGKILAPVIRDITTNLFGTPEQKAALEEYKKATPEQQRIMAEKNPELVSGVGDIFGNLNDKIKALLPSFSDLALYLGLGAGGTLLAGMGLSAAFTALGLSLDGVAIPALALGAAIGMGGLGLGAAFYGLSKIIDSVSESFTRIKDFFIGMEKIDSTKLASVGGSIGPLADGVATLSGAGFQTLISGDGLTTFAVALQKFEAVNPEKISAIGPALKSLYDGYSVFTNASIVEGLSGAITSMFSGSAVESIAESINKLGKIDSNNLNGLTPIANFFNSMKGLDINPTNIENIVSAVGVLKTTMDQNFVGDTTKVDTFTKSINDLVDSLGKLEEQLKKTPTTLTTGDTPAIKNLGGGLLTDISGNSPEDLQRQLNMQMAELIQHIVEMKEISKNTSDSISERRSAI